MALTILSQDRFGHQVHNINNQLHVKKCEVSDPRIKGYLAFYYFSSIGPGMSTLEQLYSFNS